MRKICVVITARPSYSRIKTVLKSIKEHPGLELQLVVAASALLDKYGNVLDVIKKDGFVPNELAYFIVEGENLITTAKSTGLGIVELSTIFSKLQPDIVVTIADRFETIATAISAAYLNIPLAHIQGGEVSGSIDEKVRHSVTKLSDYHFVSNKQAAERIIKMGENKNNVYVTGCPSIDLANEIYFEEEETRFNPFLKYNGVGKPFDINDDYIIVMQHPVTTELENTEHQILETLEAINSLKINTFFFWPNVDAGSDRISKMIRIFREKNSVPFIYFYKNLSPEDFLRLMKNSKCIVGNSSVGIRESSYLGTPVVNVGKRQTKRDRGNNVIDVLYDRGEIIKAIKKQAETGKYANDKLYGDGNSGKRIADKLSEVELIIEKYLSY